MQQQSFTPSILMWIMRVHTYACTCDEMQKQTIIISFARGFQFKNAVQKQKMQSIKILWTSSHSVRTYIYVYYRRSITLYGKQLYVLIVKIISFAYTPYPIYYAAVLKHKFNFTFYLRQLIIQCSVIIRCTRGE